MMDTHVHVPHFEVFLAGKPLQCHPEERIVHSHVPMGFRCPRRLTAYRLTLEINQHSKLMRHSLEREMVCVKTLTVEYRRT